MNFISHYSKSIEQLGFSPDPGQHNAATKLDAVFDNVIKAAGSQYTLFSNISNVLGLGDRKDNLRGCYLWGSVGRGKTFLMDMFYNTLDVEYKSRFHFNHFMQLIHTFFLNSRGKRIRSN